MFVLSLVSDLAHSGRVLDRATIRQESWNLIDLRSGVVSKRDRLGLMRMLSHEMTRPEMSFGRRLLLLIKSCVLEEDDRRRKSEVLILMQCCG